MNEKSIQRRSLIIQGISGFTLMVPGSSLLPETQYEMNYHDNQTLFVSKWNQVSKRPLDPHLSPESLVTPLRKKFFQIENRNEIFGLHASLIYSGSQWVDGLRHWIEQEGGTWLLDPALEKSLQSQLVAYSTAQWFRPGAFLDAISLSYKKMLDRPFLVGVSRQLAISSMHEAQFHQSCLGYERSVDILVHPNGSKRVLHIKSLS